MALSQGDVRDIVAVNYRQIGINGTTYLMIVDLDNVSGTGPYKHTNITGGIKLAGFHGTLIKSIIAEKWRTFVGTILSINTLNATIGWIRPGSIDLQETDDVQISESILQFPIPLDLTVSSNDYKTIATSFKETVTAVNSLITLNDVSGIGRTPEVGDLIVRVEPITSIVGTISIHYFAWYAVE